MSHHLTPLWAGRMTFPPPQVAGPIKDTAAGNYQRGPNQRATTPWGHSFQLGIQIGRFYEKISPLLYPKGEQDLLGSVATQAVAPKVVQSPVWPYYGTMPLAQQPFKASDAPWFLPPGRSGSTGGKRP